MSEQTLTLKERALQAAETARAESEARQVEDEKNRRERAEMELREVLATRLDLRDGIEVESNSHRAYARVTDLPGVKFFTGTSRWELYAAPDYIVPNGDEYNFWDENPLNRAIPAAHGIQGLAELGVYLQELDARGPIVIHPWPKEEPEPEPTPEPMIQVGLTYATVDDDDTLVKRLNAGWNFVAVLHSSETWQLYLICQ